MFVFGKFGVLCFLEIAVLRFALLPFYRRNEIVRILQSVSDPSSNSLFSLIKSYLDCFKFVKKWVTSYHKLRENWICLKELVRNRILSSFQKRGLHFRCFWENFPSFFKNSFSVQNHQPAATWSDKPISAQCFAHIETSQLQLTFDLNEMTGFHMRTNLVQFGLTASNIYQRLLAHILFPSKGVTEKICKGDLYHRFRE